MDMIVGFVWEFMGRESSQLLALLALGVTFRHASATRRHNILSVRPFLTSFVTKGTTDREGRASVRLMNHGLGPAFIRSFAVLKDGGRVVDLESDARAVLGGRPIKSLVTSSLGNSYAVPPGETHELLGVELTLKEGESIEDIVATLNCYDLVVTYACGYKKKYTFDSKKNENKSQERRILGIRIS